MNNILLIEDELNVATFLKKGLEENGYEVCMAYDGDAGLALLKQTNVDLIILDIILPGINGIEVCKKIRAMGYKQVRVLMLTALGTTDSVVKGLDSGADDYLPKPFKLKELLARIRALLRRKSLIMPEDDLLEISDLKLDQNAKTVIRAGVELRLTSTEYHLLEFFMKNQNKVLSRIELLENVWSINFNMGTNVVDVYVNYLRNKIEKGFSSRLIHTVIGMGYIMKEEQ